ncbi:hypothetical protein JAB5_27110 [Janthinobacterium sp. HH103]|uniref:hypothetical protein n=1 Tax=unclassified Janthinobacterium TaxID=2610881 RepID=UPI0008748832|nr:MULTISPECIES: hypothetical protein [unclassified Janthinobacterium]OEZ69270.1 hypothetical protein JAB2_14560 [Janthinobacterium sp. HH100]OEZ76402.1 hypothetical protein JAB5_27110 [Janthinobacterium sp. HH103]QOU76231.1 hypothetical protein JAB4_057310 [Janthinobacterium sp. HH102]
MNTFRRAPISHQDQKFFESLSKNIGRHVAAAAHLPDDFPQFFRHAGEFGAKCFGSTSRQRLFAEVESRPPVFEKGLTRLAVQRQFEFAIKNGADVLKADGVITSKEARAVVDAAPDIVRAVAKDLQYLEVDRYTFERTELDPRLLAAKAPKFEYAVMKGHPLVFDFEKARQGLRDAAGENSSDALNKVTPDRVRQIVQSSVLSPFDAVKQGLLPLTHIPIVLTDDAGQVVGVSMQHPAHHGVLPVCCEDETRFWTVAAALYTSAPAQNQYGDDSSLRYADPTDIRTYSPNSPFPSMFNATEDNRGPAVHYAQVSLESAMKYLAELKKAVNGERVQCREPKKQLLKSASLSSISSGSPSKGTTCTIWGLVSYQSQHGQSKVMSVSGTTKGIFHNGAWADQWYLRQDYWLDEADVPELGLPTDHFMVSRPYDDVTKVIPDGVEDFTRRALEHAASLPKEQSSDGAIHALVIKLKEQKKRLQRVKDALEEEAAAKAKARLAGLASVGPDVLAPI